MKLKITFIILIAMAFSSCKKDKDPKVPNNGCLTFGSFYGFCQGEECIEIFKLDSTHLWEDSKDKYPARDTFYEGDFKVLSKEKFINTTNLMSSFPMQLLNEKDTVFGCPDCTDGGGIYLEYKFNGIHKFWIIDNFKTNVPAYLHSFMDEVHTKLDNLKD